MCGWWGMGGGGGGGLEGTLIKKTSNYQKAQNLARNFTAAAILTTTTNQTVNFSFAAEVSDITNIAFSRKGKLRNQSKVERELVTQELLAVISFKIKFIQFN